MSFYLKLEKFAKKNEQNDRQIYIMYLTIQIFFYLFNKTF